MAARRRSPVHGAWLLRPVGYLLARIAIMVAISLLIVYLVMFGVLVLDARAASPGVPVPFSHHVHQASLHVGAFLKNVLHGQLGTVPELGGRYRLVSDILAATLRNSLGLLLPALLLGALLGTALGAAAALTRHRGRRATLVLSSFAGVAAPSFLIAVILQTLAIRYRQYFGSRLVSVGGYAWDWEHMLLPLLVLTARPTAYIARATYTGLLEIMRQDYIRTAFAKGLSLRRTVLTHALRNLAIPLLTAIGISLRFNLSALPIVEYIFAWPGMGRRLLEAIQDPTPVLAATIAVIISLLIQLVSLLLDISYRLIDPRIRGGL